ncbi:MAG TPA: HAMP domain-containing sensor histidine kinase [Bacteroidia bacterium]|nr:HAMP domain-containing sensor histidine kinase [Bacteroidia bacterium]
MLCQDFLGAAVRRFAHFPGPGEKDKELNAKAMKQQQLIRWSLIGGLFLLFISVISIYWRYRFKQRANILLEKQKQEIEHTLQELTVTSDELNKVMEQKEKLTSILAHDLRTPLRFMTTISEYLYKNMHAITDEELKELSFEMSRSSKSTFAFAEELLTWLGIQKNNYKVECAATNIHQLMDELHAFFSDIARMNGTQIKVEDSGNLFVDTDERLLKIILRNLIDNAIKYTTDGTITLSVFRNEKEEVEIQVRDTGEGMTNEQLEKLNDRNTFGFPFEIKDKLGFQIVRDLSTLIKCQVHIESVIKKGTTVKLIFSKHIENS